MSYTLVTTSTATAIVTSLDQDGALDAARTAWDSGKWTSVRLLTADGAPLWKRGTSGDSETEARDRDVISRAAGLQNLTLGTPEIGGLADLDQPFSRHAKSFEVHSGTPGLEGLLACGGTLPRLRDLLTYLDERLTAPAAITGWEARPGPWPNPAHWHLSVTLDPGAAVG